jgi:hypothetical protein
MLATYKTQHEHTMREADADIYGGSRGSPNQPAPTEHAPNHREAMPRVVKRSLVLDLAMPRVVQLLMQRSLVLDSAMSRVAQWIPALDLAMSRCNGPWCWTWLCPDLCHGLSARLGLASHRATAPNVRLGSVATCAMIARRGYASHRALADMDTPRCVQSARLGYASRRRIVRWPIKGDLAMCLASCNAACNGPWC